jgi:predicted permease
MFDWIKVLASRIHGLLARREVDRDFQQELDSHLEMLTEENIRKGLPPEEARRAARLHLGGITQLHETNHELWGLPWLENVVQDLRYAVRQLRRNPGFAAVALITLALGIGATTVMFSIVNGVLLRPLPYLQPSKLVRLYEQTDWKTAWGDRWHFAYPNFLDCRRESRSLAMAAWRYAGGTIRESGQAEYVDTLEVSANLFSILGVRLFRGRGFRSEEDQLGALPVAIISYRLWRRLHGADTAAIGKPIVFDDKSYTVVGITPPSLRVNGETFDLFTLLGQDRSPDLQNRDRHPGINVVARLQPGATLVEAQTEMGLIGRRLAAQFPKSNGGRTFMAEPLRPEIGDVSSMLWILMGAVSLVLLIACVNVASLLLARAVSRERELAMRAALGASRSRLVRQCLTESAVLGVSGGALGMILAGAGIRPFVVFWPQGLPRAQEVQLDWQVLLFAVAAALLSSLLFGLAPALRTPGRGLEQTLRARARTVAGTSRRLHSAYVIAEIALATVLLVSAGILGRTLLRPSSVNPGVNVRNVLTTRAALSPGVLANPGRTRVAWNEVLDDAKRVPGVDSVAMVDTVPMREGNNEIPYWTSPALPPQDRTPLALATCVTPEYLRVMGIPLLKGRFFDAHDRQGHENVVVIDDVLARHALGRQDPLGKLIWFPGSGSPFSSGTDNSDAARIVGVVGHVRYWGIAGDDQAQVRAELYYPFAQVAGRLVRRWSELMSIAIRTDVAPLSVVRPLRHAVRGEAGDQALYEVRTMEQLANGSLARQRFLLLLFSIFAGLALLLACIGLYGVLAYLTNQRVPEFGVRIALGADRREVMRLVLRQSLRMSSAGIGFGIPASLAAGRLLEHLVAGVQSIDLLTIAMMIFLLIVAALFASFAPARRAAKVDPMVALRHE